MKKGETSCHQLQKNSQITQDNIVRSSGHNPIEEAAEELISKSLLGGQKIDFTPDSQEPDSPEP